MFNVVGAFLAFVVGCIRILLLRKLPVHLSENRGEQGWLFMAFIAAALGSASLLVIPAYQGSTCSLSISDVQGAGSVSYELTQGPNGEAVVRPHWEDGQPEGQSSAEVSAHCENTSSAYYQTNGSDVIAPFTVPIVFTLIPWLFFKLRPRPLVECLMAMFLSALLFASVFSLWGLAFSPSALFMLCAASVALRSGPAISSKSIVAPHRDTK
nr:hypothetical protein [Oceanococcus sp. HetDA_MAG_MS8]